MTATAPSIHASAVLVGATAVLIRGPSGAGKSQLAFDLICAGGTPPWPATRLVGDDRVILRRDGGSLLVSPAPPLMGLIEVRGLGLRRCPCAPSAAVGLVVDLWAADADRLPQPEALTTEIEGVEIPRIPVGRNTDPRRLILAWLVTDPANT